MSHTVDLMRALGPGPVDRLWDAEKMGWRCFVMGNHRIAYRHGSRLRAAWLRGYDGVSRSADPAALML